jgi:hypothetical protein
VGWFVIIDCGATPSSWFQTLDSSVGSWFHQILGCAEFQLLGCAGFSVLDCAESVGSCRRINSEEGEGLVNDLKAVAPYDGDVAKMVAALENFRYDGMEMARLRAESV